MAAAYLIFGHLSFFVPSIIALFMGVVLSLAVGNPFLETTQKITTRLLKYCLIITGFGLDFNTILASEYGLPILALIALALALFALVIAPWYGVNKRVSATIAALFIAAALAGSYLPIPENVTSIIARLSNSALNATLYLVGSGITRQALKATPLKSISQALLLWCVIAILSLEILWLL